jgi:hypothetical protein
MVTLHGVPSPLSLRQTLVSQTLGQRTTMRLAAVGHSRLPSLIHGRMLRLGHSHRRRIQGTGTSPHYRCHPPGSTTTRLAAVGHSRLPSLIHGRMLRLGHSHRARIHRTTCILIILMTRILQSPLSLHSLRDVSSRGGHAGRLPDCHCPVVVVVVSFYISYCSH